MSEGALEQVIVKASSDSRFRAKLVDNFESAVKPYKLTSGEKNRLRQALADTEAGSGHAAPTRVAMTREAATREAATREAATREAATREAATREAQTREAQTREAQTREAQTREASWASPK